MAKQKRSGRTPVPSPRDTPSPVAGSAGRRQWLVGAGAATAAIALILWGRQVLRAPIILPLPNPEVPSARPAFEDFVGAETCGTYHTTEYASWKGSTHGRAGGPPTADRVIAPFNGVPLTFRDAVVTPSRASGDFVFIVRQDNRPTQTLRV